jgi:Kdo2-lipid IVA lauroyltransferase/acyltransferase
MDIKSYLAIALIKFLGLFSLRGARRLGDGIAWLLRVSNSGMYKVTLRNLELCLPHLSAMEREQLARQSLRETARSIAETGIAWGGSEKEMTRNAKCITRVRNEELFTAALAANSGVMLITLHYGNWEWLNAYLPQRCKLTGLYKIAKMPVFEQWMLNTRQRGGVRMVHGTRAGVETFIQHYVDGRTVLFAPDQEPSTKSGVFAPFFGVPALTPKLPYELMQRNPAGRVLFIYMHRVKDGFELVFQKAPELMYNADPVLSATGLNQGFEQCIAADPAQYQWDYKRFKRRPEGESKVYR